jgi:hypothetical protein
MTQGHHAVSVVLFVGVLWLIGLAHGEWRRAYVMAISEQAVDKVPGLLRSSRDAVGRVLHPTQGGGA